MGRTLSDYGAQQVYYFDETLGPTPSSTLWNRYGSAVKTTEPQTCVEKMEDFIGVSPASNTIGGWTFTQATSGTVVEDTTNPGGIAIISAGAVTAGQGVNWQMTGSPLLIATNKPIAYETYVQFQGLTTLKGQYFIGLAAQSTALITGGAMAAVDRLGFQGIFTSLGVMNAVARGGGTAVTGTGFTIVNNTFYRLGIFATTTQVDFYVNGLIVASKTTQIPTGALAPIFVVQANATVTPALSLDWWKLGGYR